MPNQRNSKRRKTNQTSANRAQNKVNIMLAAMRVAMTHALDGTTDRNRQNALLKGLTPGYALLRKRLPERNVKANSKRAENVVMQRRIANRTVAPYVQILKNSDDITDVRYVIRQVKNASMITDEVITRRFRSVIVSDTSSANIHRVQVITALVRAGAGSSRYRIPQVIRSYIHTGHHAFYELLEALAGRDMLYIGRVRIHDLLREYNLGFSLTKEGVVFAYKYIETGMAPYLALVELALSKKVLSLNDLLIDLRTLRGETLITITLEGASERAHRWPRLVQVLDVMKRHGLDTAGFLLVYFGKCAYLITTPRYTEVRDLIRLGAVVDARPAGKEIMTELVDYYYGNSNINNGNARTRFSMLDLYILFLDMRIAMYEGPRALRPKFDARILQLFQRAGLTALYQLQWAPHEDESMLLKYKLVTIPVNRRR